MSKWIALPMLFLMACSSQPKVNVLSPAKLEPVILDLQLAEAYANGTNVTRDAHAVSSQHDSFALYRLRILNKHGISEQEYTRSMEWYSEHPDQLDSMYTHVLTKLNLLKEQKPLN